MKKNKLKNIIRKFVIGLLLSASLTISIFKVVNASVNGAFEPYVIKQESIVYKDNTSSVIDSVDSTVKETKGRILIYHTHTCEDYIDSDVVEMGKDLAKKLEKKGYIVEHIEKDFVKDDYNNAYYESREFLKGIDLSQYDLIIDMHRDALDKPNTVTINDVPVAKGMLVYAKSSDNYDTAKKIGDSITENMSKFDGGLMRGAWEYNKGISYFNSDLDDNILLFEAGNNSNNKIQIMRLNTYMASAIDTYLNK